MNDTKTVFPLLSRDELPLHMQDVWDRSEQRRGEAKFIAGIGHSPKVFDWYAQDFYTKLFYGGDVPAKYKELGRLRLSSVHGCKSCNKGNRLDAKDNGLTDAQISNIDDVENDAFDAADKAVLALADLVSLDGAGAQLDTQLYSDLKAHFSDGQIFELGMALAMLAGMARFLFAFDLVEKEEYCAF